LSAHLKIHRTYRFRDKDPVIDEMRTLVQDEGLIKKLHIVSQLSGVSTSTLDNWFNGDTISPQNRTICAVTSSLGYERTWEKVKNIEIDKELKIAMAWNKRQEKLREQASSRVGRRPQPQHKERRVS
jgi:hypothetical protein